MAYESLITKIGRAIDEYRLERLATTKPTSMIQRWLPTPLFFLVTLSTAAILASATQVAALPSGSTTSVGLQSTTTTAPLTSYPYVVHLRHFALDVYNYCYGYVPGDPTIIRAYPECSSLDRFLRGTKFIAPSGTGFVGSANNLPSASGGPRWGYSYSFFLNNPGAARSITLPLASCNDVALYVSTGQVRADNLAESSTLAYHRFPGGVNTIGLRGCPCNDAINPTINIPSGAFRLTAITRGAACTSYIGIGKRDETGVWVSDLGLETDWDGLYTYLRDDATPIPPTPTPTPTKVAIIVHGIQIGNPDPSKYICRTTLVGTPAYKSGETPPDWDKVGRILTEQGYTVYLASWTTSMLHTITAEDAARNSAGTG